MRDVTTRSLNEEGMHISLVSVEKNPGRPEFATTGEHKQEQATRTEQMNNYLFP